MKRIFILSMCLGIGGVERSLVSLLRTIDYEAYHVDLMLVETEGILRQYLPDQVRVIAFPERCKWVFLPKGKVIHSLRNAIGWNLNLFRYVFYLLKGLLMRNMGRARQQLIKSAMHTLPEVHGEYDAAIDYAGLYKAYILSKVNAIRKISWIHGDYRIIPRDQTIDLDDYAKVTSIITVSPTCLNIFTEVYPQYQGKCFMLPNVTSKAYIAEMANRMDEPVFRTNEIDLNILDITRLDMDKGFDIAIEACSLLLQQGHNLRWYILGDGPHRKRIEVMIRQAGMQDHFILLGSVANPYPFIKQADIIVHCSRFEGRSVAIDEAMLLGKHIILTDYPTAGDQIQSGVNGLICAMSAKGVSGAVEQLLADENMRKRFSDNLADYDISRDISMAVFEEVIG